jgi:uncharacterized protein (DUF2164 family)
MSIKLNGDTEKYLLDSIKRFVDSQLDTSIGDLKASLVLDFFLREIGPSVYTQAIADAQTYVQEKVADLGGARYQAEFDYWKKR